MSKSESRRWSVYIVRCADDSLYTGITTDLERRLREHNFAKIGAKYTRPRRPVSLVYQEAADSRSQASKREKEIKNLTQKQKLSLIAGK
ncbi:MAG: GIY-YIG nuclease family protein [Acidiferrobacterales bacterium]